MLMPRHKEVRKVATDCCCQFFFNFALRLDRSITLSISLLSGPSIRLLSSMPCRTYIVLPRLNLSILDCLKLRLLTRLLTKNLFHTQPACSSPYLFLWILNIVLFGLPVSSSSTPVSTFIMFVSFDGCLSTCLDGIGVFGLSTMMYRRQRQ